MQIQSVILLLHKRTIPSRRLCKSKMIILICINRGFPEPLVEADDERTYFSVTLYIHPDFGKRQSGDMINLKLLVGPMKKSF